ncbi:MAG: sigma-54-dependent transcriptional regulator [Phycisphaerae bacterium]
MANLLLVDDERPLLHSMQLQLNRAGHCCHCCETLAAANQLLSEQEPELAVIDIRLPDGNGLDLVRQVRAEGRGFPIVVLTAFGSIPTAVSAMRDGADDYIEKPVDLDQLTFIVERNLETQRLKGRIELYERTQPDPQASPELIGQSPAFRQIIDLASRVADPGVAEAAEMPNVLITGQTGTGKDVLARHIHSAGPLAGEPFVHVDCAALPRELIESELFGHERGAFTDAKSSKRGLLEIAGGGTVFLNEIGDLPLDLQAKLLTTLERRSYRRVGGTRQLQMNARIIAATNADLAARVEQRAFREDLYYRLNVFNIHLPPLRERGQDVALLAEHFVARLCRKYRRPRAQLAEQTQRIIVNYAWPGNVRELLHVLERACLLAENGIINPEHLSLTPIGAAPVATGQDELPDVTLAQAERKLIERALQRSGGNVSQAARLLGITRGALRRRLENTETPKPES